MDENKTLRERIEAADIEIYAATELTGQVEVPEGWDPETRSFSVTLRNPATDMTLTTPWTVGPNGDPGLGEADEVLHVLLSDARTALNAGSFEAWAADLDLNPDSRKQEARYHDAMAWAESLRDFLGDDAEDFLWRTDGI